MLKITQLTLSIGCTTLSLNFLDIVTFSLISPSGGKLKEDQYYGNTSTLSLQQCLVGKKKQ